MIGFIYKTAKSLFFSEATAEPNPPNWDSIDSVILLKPEDTAADVADKVKDTTDNILPDTEHVWNNPNSTETLYGNARHFVEDRHAILVEPGTYKGIDIQVGYYAQVLGLGKSPSDVKFTECEYGPYCPALRKNERVGDNAGLALDTFWRSVENFQTEANSGQLWAVSQAAPIRRVHVAKNSDSGSNKSGNLYLHDNGARASGGHAANVLIDGKVELGSQQQFCFRSVSFKDKVPKEDLGAWSFMFVDCKNAPDERDGITSKPYGEWNSNPSVSVEEPKITVEKPFIVCNADKKYDLHVPAPRNRDVPTSLGASFGDDEKVDIRPFEEVKVAVANTDMKHSSGKYIPDVNVAQKINDALREGKDIVLSPGMYYLDKPLEITRSNQVILGIGLATLIAPEDGSPAIKVPPGLEGVRIAGLMLEACVLKKTDPNMTSCFIQWGENGDAGNPKNPGVLTDIFARVGGSNLNRTVSTDVMVRVDSDNVYGDNLWLWRADHVKLRPGELPNVDGLDYHQVTLGECPCATGLEVNGKDVIMHGLAVEHTEQHNTIWNGEGGKVMFYQNELPYDVNEDFGNNGYVGYKVDENVKTHLAKGVGVYSNFRDYEVPVSTGITHPDVEGITFQNPFSVWLDNRGHIKSVINNKGDALEKKGDVGRYKKLA